MVVPVSPAALIISTTMPDGTAALPDFTLSIVIGIIRIQHECEGGIEKSVPRISEACRVRTNCESEGRIPYLAHH